MSILDRITDIINKRKRAYGFSSCEDVYLALGRNEINELDKFKYCPYPLESAEYNLYNCNVKFGTIFGLKIIEMDSDNYLELFRKL